MLVGKFPFVGATKVRVRASLTLTLTLTLTLALTRTRTRTLTLTLTLTLTKDELSRHILRGQFAVPVHVTREPETLLRAMMVVDASRREPCERLARHAWLERASTSEREICTEHQKAGELEEGLMAELAELGVGGESARESVTQCRFDHVHTTYQLLRKKQQHPAPSMESVELESQLRGGNLDEARIC